MIANPFGPAKPGHSSVSHQDNEQLNYELPLESTNLPGIVLEEDRHRGQVPLLIVSGFVCCLLFLQCFRLQVIAGPENRAKAEGNSVRLITVQPERGLILDKNGTVLAQNNRKLALNINPQSFPRNKADQAALFALLTEKIELTQAEQQFIEATLTKSPEPFAIRTNLTQEQSLLYYQWFANIPGVQVTEIPTRHYADLTSLGQLLGYMGTVSETDLKNGYAANQRVGKTGIELQYNQLLTGTPGKLHAEVDVQGSIIRYITDELATPAVVGKTITLSLDSTLQQAVADALQRELDRRTQKFGPLPQLGASAVVMNPQTGAILAMVSLPDYSSSSFAQGISKDEYAKLLDNPGNPLLNRSIQGQYAPGSTLKPLVAAGGLQEGVISPNTSVVTPEAIMVGNFRFPDWKYHGQTNTRQAIAESNNIFFYAVGGGWAEGGISGLGEDRLTNYLRRFGLGAKTGVDLPGEQPGLVPDPAWKKSQFNESWFIGNTYQTAIGQGYLLTTPLQMATATAAIANGGTVYSPKLIYSTTDSENNSETVLPPQILNQNFVSPENIQVVREGMRQAVVSGSARLLNQLTVQSAGKTGTAQFGNQGLTHAWYTGFAPYDNPEIAFAIVIEGGGESFYSSVPVAEEILRAAFNQPLEPGQALFSQPSQAVVAEIAAEFGGER